MGPSTGWAAQQPLLRLGVASTVGVVAAVLSAEIVAILGSSTGMVLIAPIATAVSLAVVAMFCWFTSAAVQFTTKPPVALRYVRNGLVGGLGVLLAVSVSGSFSGERVGLPTRLHVPLAVVVAAIAVAYACVAIPYVRREQAYFTAQNEADPEAGSEAAVIPVRLPLERMRTTHGLVAGVVGVMTLMMFAAGTTPYIFPFAGLVLIPSVSTWAYAALRLSRLDRRPLPDANPDHPPRFFRTARAVSAVVLAMVPIGVLWWVWRSVDSWGLDGVDLAGVQSKADLVLWISVAAGLVAAVTYPFFAIEEALRTPTKEGEDGVRAGPEDEPLPEWRIEQARVRRAPVLGPP